MFVLDTRLLSKLRCKYKLGLSLSFASKRNNIKTCEKKAVQEDVDCGAAFRAASCGTRLGVCWVDRNVINVALHWNLPLLLGARNSHL